MKFSHLTVLGVFILMSWGRKPLEDVLELWKIRKSENEEDIQDIYATKNDTTISWEQYKWEQIKS